MKKISDITVSILVCLMVISMADEEVIRSQEERVFLSGNIIQSTVTETSTKWYPVFREDCLEEFFFRNDFFTDFS